MSKIKDFLEKFDSIKEIKNQLNRSTLINFLEGAGLSKIYQYASNQTPFVSISAERKEYNKATNKAKTAQLVSAFRSAGLGGIQLIGHYKYNDGTDADEDSFFIPYLGNDVEGFQRICQRWCSQFDQESVLFSDGEDVGYLSSSSFKPMYSAVTFDPSKFQGAWSSIRGKRFSFIESGFTGTIGGVKLWKELGLIPDIDLPQIAKLKQLKIKFRTQI